MKYENAIIEVVNWDKYNPRTDSKKPTWFRLDNDVALGDGFHGLTCEQKWVWIVVLSLASKKNGSKFTWNSAYVEAVAGIKPKVQEQALEIFEKFVRLRVSRDVTLRDSPATNETYETNNNAQPVAKAPGDFDLQALYFKYPRRVGKGRGLKIAAREIKTREDFDALDSAIARYSSYVAAQNIEPKFVKHFSTFMGEWKDWLDPGAGSTGTPKQDPKKWAYEEKSWEEALGGDK